MSTSLYHQRCLVCVVDGCGKPTKKESRYCSGHSARKWRYGDPLYSPKSGLPHPKLGREPVNCSALSCDQEEYVEGLCRKHFFVEKRYGTTNPICSAGSCDKAPIKGGFCGAHYQKYLKWGDPLFVKPRKKWADGYGYIRMSVPKGTLGATVNRGRSTIAEHRFVMQQVLGRALFENENVHHINGIRGDNRPDNLELWISSQPPGQRVSDHLEWAREIITRYGDLVEIASISNPKKRKK